MIAPVALPPIRTEDQRNRLLRRADWRFLLADVNPGRTICFADGSIAEAARAVSRSFSGRSERLDAGYDLAVAVDPRRETLRQAFDSLRPGGSLYAEWHSWRTRAPSSIRRRLVHAGFRNISLHWPRPDPEIAPAAIWLPVENPEVLRYYLDNRPPPRNVARRLARAVRRFALLPRPRFRLACPVSSVAIRPAAELERGRPTPVTPGEPARGDLAPEVLSEIRTDWTSWELGIRPPRTLSTMLITRGPEASGKAVALIFADGTARPVLAVKRPRIPESTAALRREASILRAVREQTSVGEGVPRVLAAGETTSGYRLIETAFTGLPAFVIVTRTNFALLANRATDWLVRLAGRRMAVPRSEWWPRVVEPRVADFEEHFGSAVEPGLLSECRRLLDSLGPLPVVWEQRDFSPWNVLVDRSGEIAAVDWESAEPEGLPLLDLVYFLTYLSFSVDRAARTGRFIESYRRSRDPGFFTGRIVRACMDRYAAELALKEPEYRAFRLLTWIVHSRSEYLQLSSATGGQPSREALERSLFFQLWRSEIR